MELLSCDWCKAPIKEGNYYQHPATVGDGQGLTLCGECEQLREKRLDRKEAATRGILHCAECSRPLAKRDDVIGYPKYDWTGRLSLLYYCQPCLARVQEKSE